jgi:hypothetical protein
MGKQDINYVFLPLPLPKLTIVLHWLIYIVYRRNNSTDTGRMVSLDLWRRPKIRKERLLSVFPLFLVYNSH